MLSTRPVSQKHVLAQNSDSERCSHLLVHSGVITFSDKITCAAALVLGALRFSGFSFLLSGLAWPAVTVLVPMFLVLQAMIPRIKDVKTVSNASRISGF